MPYRNGILHGMDLGYDNLTVATKAWALLFAAGDLARQIENPAKPSPPKPTWKEGMRQLAEIAKDKERLQLWEPRQVEVGRDIPAVADSTAYNAHTPERAVVEFLEFWRKRNYGGMAALVSSINFYGIKDNSRPRIVRQAYADKELGSFALVKN